MTTVIGPPICKPGQGSGIRLLGLLFLRAHPWALNGSGPAEGKENEQPSSFLSHQNFNPIVPPAPYMRLCIYQRRSMKVQLERLFRLFLVLACVSIPYSAHAVDPNGYLYIGHAASGRNISSTTNPEYPVDLAIGGHCIAQGMSFGEIRGPFTLPAGSYSVKVSVADAANPCSAASVFSAGIGLAAGSTSMGLISVNSAHQISARVFSVNLSAVPVGQGRVIVANTTSDNLIGSLTAGDGTPPPSGASFAAGTVSVIAVPRGEYSAAIFPQGSSTAATGPLEVEVVSRNVYLVVLAGSTANGSVQFIGPHVIRNVF